MEGKEQLLYSLNAKIDNLSKEIDIILKDNSITDCNKIYVSIGDVLHWLGACIDRIEEVMNFDSNSEELKVAFKGAINAQKHGAKLAKFDNFINCTRFPFVLDAVFSDEGLFLWIELEEDIIVNKNQIRKYNTLLKGKDILETINNMKQIIEDNFKKIG